MYDVNLAKSVFFVNRISQKKMDKRKKNERSPAVLADSFSFLY